MIGIGIRCGDEVVRMAPCNGGMTGAGEHGMITIMDFTHMQHRRRMQAANRQHEYAIRMSDDLVIGAGQQPRV